MAKKLLASALLSASFICLDGMTNAHAQSLSIEIENEGGEAAVKSLEDLKKSHSDVSGLRTSVRIMRGVGDIANVVPILGPRVNSGLKVVGSATEWSADKFEKALYVQAADTISAFVGVTDNSLNDDQVRRILAANPNYASLVNAAGIQTVKNVVLESRRDAAAFKVKLDSARSEIQTLRAESKNMAANIETNFDDLDDRLNEIGTDVTLAAETTRIVLENKTFEIIENSKQLAKIQSCLLYTSPSPRDRTRSRMPSSA